MTRCDEIKIYSNESKNNYLLFEFHWQMNLFKQTDKFEFSISIQKQAKKFKT